MKKIFFISLMFFISTTLLAQEKLRIVKTYDAPQAIGPYSQAIEANGFLFLSGQIAIDPTTNSVTGTNIESQTRQIFKNIKAVLKSAGTKLSNVIKCTVFMVDLNDFGKMNSVYEEEFDGHKPARSTVQVARLPKDVLIEIECVAIK